MTNHYTHLSNLLGLRIGRKIVMVPVSEIDVEFYVRVAVDEDRVLTFAEMIENGYQFDPILLTEDKKILVDGRTRLEAHKLADKTEIAVVFCEEADCGVLIQAAALSNSKPTDSRPPNTQDLKQMTWLMFKAGLSYSNVKLTLERLALPKPTVRRLANDGLSRLNQEKVSAARGAVAKGLSISQAAKDHGVDEKTLQIAVAGKKKTERSVSVNGLKRSGERHVRGFAQTMAQTIRYAFIRFQDGEIGEEDVEALLNQEGRWLKRMKRAHEDRKKRFVALLDPK